MIYHGYRSIDDHTVIQGSILSITRESEAYYVEFVKHNRKKIASDFDDMGKRKQTDLYHYNQKCKG